MIVVELPKRIAALGSWERACFERLFATSVAVGSSSSGAVVRKDQSEASRATSIFRISNRWTYEGAAFDPRRQRRTAPVNDTFIHLLRRCQTPGEACPLYPQEAGGTLPVPVPDDHCLLLEPRAKFDGYHTVIIFSEHNPLIYTEAAIVGSRR